MRRTRRGEEEPDASGPGCRPAARDRDVRDQLHRVVHDLARQPRRHHRAARNQGEPRRLAVAARVDGERLYPDVRGPPADRRRSRRPLRPQADVHHRRRTVHRRLGVRCPRADRRSARHRSGPPGIRRRDRPAAHAHHPFRRRPEGAPRPRARRMGRHRRPRHRARAPRRRRDRRGPELAVHLLGQRPDRHRPDPARHGVPAGDPRPGRRARPARPRPRLRRPVRPRVGPDPWQRAGLDEHGDRHRLRRRRRAARRRSWRGRRGRATRCSRSASSATAHSRRPTS